MKSSLLQNIVRTVFVMAFACTCSCCTTTDWELPEGYNHNSRRETIKICVDRIDISDDENIRIDSALEDQLREIVMNKFIESSRFIVLSDRGGSLAGTQDYDVSVKPFLNLLVWPTPRTAGVRTETILTIKFEDVESGAYDNTASQPKGISPLEKFVVVYEKIRITDADITNLFTQSSDAAYDLLEKAILKKFPVNGRIDSIKNFDNKTEFNLAAGTSWGIEESDDIMVYSVDDENNVTVVALTKGLVGKTSTQLQVKEWHFDDSEVKDDIYPRILQGDKTLKLYAVARKKKE